MKKNSFLEPRETAEQSGAGAVLAEGSDSIPGTHMEAHNRLKLQFQGSGSKHPVGAQADKINTKS